ncbi:helix-turn-helix domain-containing protein [Bartonella raoultii]|uniref:Helix-turn-helix domain-containing protein n=1 Tax=Bartonella raoultii TaxID=1457020 RepID=A0ABS7I6C2_9HYPH|nr:helix-turn-helix transcriptional regulator [Bartonella raoultii]MBX4336448.1 helix-turn-helix domain-containing protein [Bartonella raoultii]
MEKLKSYLTRNKLSQAEFGKQVGVAQSTINRYLRGLRFPEPEIVLKIEKTTNGIVRPVDWYVDLYPRPSLEEVGVPLTTADNKHPQHNSQV